jgi:SnoaL-like domain
VTTLDAGVQELLDKQAIHEVMMRYCRGVDRGDAALINSAYHPDAYDDHCGHIFTGETVGPGIVEWMSEVTDSTTHHITTQIIDVDGDRANSESYYMGLHLETKDGVQRRMHTVGRYVDRLERRHGEWKISNRLVVLEMAGYLPPGDLELPPLPAMGRRDRSDPSYRSV